MSKPTIVIQHYSAAHWKSLWQLRFAHLAEDGILLPDDAIPTLPGLPENDAHEWDLNHIDEVYLHGGGGFWLAWLGDEPVGFVGAQDLGGVVELRRMYVRATHRRQGIGRLLVQALINHARVTGMHVVELWTERDGVGQQLYARLGFEEVAGPGLGFAAVEQATKRSPNPGEIRMRLAL